MPTDLRCLMISSRSSLCYDGAKKVSRKPTEFDELTQDQVNEIMAELLASFPPE